MRTLHILASADRRGAEVFGSQLGAILTTRGNQADTVALRAARPGPGLDVDVIEALRRPEATWELRRRARRADAVVGHGSQGLVAGTAATALTRTPFVYRSIGDPTYWGASRSRQLRVGLQLRRAAAVTALWPAAGEAIARQYGVDPARISIIPNAVDDADLAPATAAEQTAARDRLQLGSGPVALYLGALSSEKRVGLVIDAVARVTDLHLLVAGDGPMRAEVEAHAAQQLPGRHHILGSVRDVRSLFDAADCLVLLSETEGQPGVAIEAGLCGIPVLASDVGGVSSVVVDGETGRLVPPNAPADAIAPVLEAALDGRADLGARAAERCREHFTFTTVAAQWDDLLRRVAADRR